MAFADTILEELESVFELSLSGASFQMNANQKSKLNCDSAHFIICIVMKPTKILY